MGHSLAVGSFAAGLVSFLWFIFFLAQELMPMPVHIPRSLALRVGVPLTLLMPVVAIALGITAFVRLRAEVVQRIGFDQIAATSGVLLGGVVLFLCLIVALWIVTLPT
jgi:hypothetical protein